LKKWLFRFNRISSQLGGNRELSLTSSLLNSHYFVSSFLVNKISSRRSAFTRFSTLAGKKVLGVCSSFAC